MNEPYINYTLTHSNDINETYKLLGIEAARTLLIQQIIDVIEEGAGYLNSRHVDLLCDTMTSKGYLSAINKQGITKGDIGPLAKCSFEDTTNQLIKASVFGEKDNLMGVSSNIMLGQTIPSGTGFSEILLDEEKLLQTIQEIGEVVDEQQVSPEDYDVDTLLDIDEQGCETENFKFSFE